MRDYPKHFNTKQDVLNMKKDNRTKIMLQILIDKYYGWNTIGLVEGSGLTDKTHKVIDQGEDTPELYQQEYGVMIGNGLDRLGITIEEAKSMI